MRPSSAASPLRGTLVIDPTATSTAAHTAAATSTAVQRSLQCRRPPWPPPALHSPPCRRHQRRWVRRPDSGAAALPVVASAGHAAAGSPAQTTATSPSRAAV